MFLLSDSGINVLPFWGLSPRETPDLNHTSWNIPIQSVSMITGLSASGGVYGLRGNKVYWIPVIEPFTLSKPSLSSTTREESSLFLSATTEDIGTSIINNSLESMFTTTITTDLGNSLQNEYVSYQMQDLNSTMMIWLGLDSTTLYTISSYNGTQMLYKVSTNGQSLTSLVIPLIAIDGNVIAFIVHRNFFLILILKLGHLITILPSIMWFKFMDMIQG